MIKAAIENEGVILINGEHDVILTEYTVLTQIVLKQLIRIHGKEEAFEMLAELGKLAVMHLEEENPGVEKIRREIIEKLAE